MAVNYRVLYNDVELANFSVPAYISCMLWCKHILPWTAC